MNTPGFAAVNPFQQVTHRVGMQDIPPQVLAQGLVQQLATPLSEAFSVAGAEVHVHIRQVHVIVADPATLRAAGLQRLLGSGPGFWEG